LSLFPLEIVWGLLQVQEEFSGPRRLEKFGIVACRRYIGMIQDMEDGRETKKGKANAALTVFDIILLTT
jgi:hypothetical protein